MKKKMVFKKTSRKKKNIFFFLCGVIILYFSFQALDESPLTISDKEYVDIILNNSFKKKKNISLSSTVLNIYNNPLKILSLNNSKLFNKTKTSNVQTPPAEPVLEVQTNPLIYIYNTHQTEEYAPSTFIEYNINPTVMLGAYILKDTFEKANYPTIVEEASVKEILNANNWKYSYSYKATRILMEKAKTGNPTLKYFIDVHRDSLSKTRTTVTINDKNYAKLLFIVGLENESYEGNLQFTTAINDALNRKYPGLSKGIYKKSGPGVNGIYNQDFSPYTILIEVGGYENTTTEVLNSMLAFADCFLEVIEPNENKTTN